MVQVWLPVLVKAFPKTLESRRTATFIERNLQLDNYRRHMTWELVDEKYLVTFFRLLEEDISYEQEYSFEDHYKNEDLYTGNKDCDLYVYDRNNDCSLFERILCGTGERLRIPVSIKTLSRGQKSRLFIIDMSRKLDIDMHLTVDILKNKYEVTVFREEEDDNSDDEWEW